MNPIMMNCGLHVLGLFKRQARHEAGKIARLVCTVQMTDHDAGIPNALWLASLLGKGPSLNSDPTLLSTNPWSCFSGTSAVAFIRRASVAEKSGAYHLKEALSRWIRLQVSKGFMPRVSPSRVLCQHKSQRACWS